MLWYYFHITFELDSALGAQCMTYKIEASSRVTAWRQTVEYAIGMYGIRLQDVQLYNIATY